MPGWIIFLIGIAIFIVVDNIITNYFPPKKKGRKEQDIRKDYIGDKLDKTLQLLYNIVTFGNKPNVFIISFYEAIYDQ